MSVLTALGGTCDSTSNANCATIKNAVCSSDSATPGTCGCNTGYTTTLDGISCTGDNFEVPNIIYEYVPI